jgi:hypothetical protein
VLRLGLSLAVQARQLLLLLVLSSVAAARTCGSSDGLNALHTMPV